MVEVAVVVRIRLRRACTAATRTVPDRLGSPRTPADHRA